MLALYNHDAMGAGWVGGLKLRVVKMWMGVVLANVQSWSYGDSRKVLLVTV